MVGDERYPYPSCSYDFQQLVSRQHGEEWARGQGHRLLLTHTPHKHKPDLHCALRTACNPLNGLAFPHPPLPPRWPDGPRLGGRLVRSSAAGPGTGAATPAPAGKIGAREAGRRLRTGVPAGFPSRKPPVFTPVAPSGRSVLVHHQTRVKILAFRLSTSGLPWLRPSLLLSSAASCDLSQIKLLLPVRHLFL
jgi:hypothetical protein